MKSEKKFGIVKFTIKINYKQDDFTYFLCQRLVNSFQILSSFSRVVIVQSLAMRKQQCTHPTGPVELLHDCFMLMAWDSPDSDFLRTAPSWVALDKTQFKLRHIEEMGTQCLKITEKVSFNITSEASYVYILSAPIHNLSFKARRLKLESYLNLTSEAVWVH